MQESLQCMVSLCIRKCIKVKHVIEIDRSVPIFQIIIKYQGDDREDPVMFTESREILFSSKTGSGWCFHPLIFCFFPELSDLFRVCQAVLQEIAHRHGIMDLVLRLTCEYCEKGAFFPLFYDITT